MQDLLHISFLFLLCFFVPILYYFRATVAKSLCTLSTFLLLLIINIINKITYNKNYLLIINKLL